MRLRQDIHACVLHSVRLCSGRPVRQDVDKDASGKADVDT